ncbi:MAG: hypothetical protein LV481_10070 [Methylacidiphilales bacterium]|nr:hypothetical protein [Candidatus Methylacidiphilales bacterium]
MNWLHGAGFSGLKLEPVFIQPPLYAAYLGNFFLIMAHNLAEAPWTLSNDFVSFFVNVQHSAMGSLLGRYFQPAAFAFYPWIAVEEAGLGLWVVISLFFMLASSIPLRDGRALSLFSGGISRPWIIALGLWVIFFFYMLLANSNQPARLICPFYVLLVPTLLKGRIFRSNRFWRYARVITAMTMMLGLLSDLTLTENPLIALHSWQNARRQSDLDAQGLAQQHLPSGEKAVGCIRAWNERESWLWHPYGTRKVVELPYHPDLEQMNHAGIRYLFISSAMLQLNQQTIESWSEANHFQIIAPLPPEPSNWYLVKAIQTPSRV